MATLAWSCKQNAAPASIDEKRDILVLGIAQDGGFPHIGCKKACCVYARQKAGNNKFVTSLAVVDWDAHLLLC